MAIVEDIIQNLNHIIGIVLQVLGVAIFARLYTIISLSTTISNSPPENPSRKERTALRLVSDVGERNHLLRLYVLVHLLLDITTLIIGPWYAFVTLIPMMFLIGLWPVLRFRDRGYFRHQ